MAEIRTVTTLTYKREEIERAIVGYEQKVEQARADLAHITAAIAIFNASDDPKAMRAYVDTHRIWKRGELMRLCKGFLESEGPLSTRALAERAMTAAGLEVGDAVLRKSVAFKIVQAMRQQHLRGAIADAGKRHTARIWALPLAAKSK
jgi:hypothetical protein